MEAERNCERSFAQEEGNLHNENKNQGLINTIVNHKKKRLKISKTDLISV